MHWTRTATSLCLLLLLAGVPGVAQPVSAATIGGQVLPTQSRPDPPSFNPYPGRAHTVVEESTGNPDSDWGDVVVFLRGPIAGTLPIRSGPHQLAQRGRAFVPRVLTILPGEEVEFPNFDPFYHNVFSYSPAKRFDLGKYAEGGTGSVVFPEPGEVRIFCDIHSEMNAVILVMENRFFTRPDEEGRFRLDGVPPGRYELVLWHPDHPEKTRQLEVPSETTELVLGF